MDVIATLGTALTVVKQLIDVADASKNAQAKLALAQLVEKLADIKLECARLVEENAAIKSANATKTSNELTFRDNVYWGPDNAGPFCPRCKDGEGKLSRLGHATANFRAFGHWKCTVCSKYFAGT
jgi:hypothetical protein